MPLKPKKPNHKHFQNKLMFGEHIKQINTEFDVQ